MKKAIIYLLVVVATTAMSCAGNPEQEKRFAIDQCSALTDSITRLDRIIDSMEYAAPTEAAQAIEWQKMKRKQYMDMIDLYAEKMPDCSEKYAIQANQRLIHSAPAQAAKH